MIGATVGNYRILERVGQGGMGVVYRAVDQMLAREVAIKILSRELSGEPRIVERFRSEAMTLARLNHPNIATLYSLFLERGDLFMVMEFLRGEALEARIRRAGALSLPEGVAVVCQALEGVQHAHEFGVVHRDLKPSNLMIMATGIVKVMDFGIARALGAARQTQEGRLVGTIEYMSPEQIKGCDADRRSDLYSMGVVLYECLTGQLPFSATSEFELMRAHVELPPIPPRSVNPALPSEIEAILMQSLAKDPAARFQSAADFRLALLPLLESGARLAGRSTTGDLARQILTPPVANAPPPGATQPPPLPPPSPETRFAGEAATSGGLEPPSRETRLAAEPAGPAGPAGREVPLGLVIQQAFSRLGWKHYSAAAALVILLGFAWLLWPAGDGGGHKLDQGQQPPPIQEAPARPTGGLETLPPSPNDAAAPIDYEELPGVIPPESGETPGPPPAVKPAVKRAQPRGAGSGSGVTPAPGRETAAEPQQPAGQEPSKSAEKPGDETPPPADVSAPTRKTNEEDGGQGKEDARRLLRRHLGKDKKKEP